jgi:hypothetical protein
MMILVYMYARLHLSHIIHMEICTKNRIHRGTLSDSDTGLKIVLILIHQSDSSNELPRHGRLTPGGETEVEYRRVLYKYFDWMVIESNNLCMG